MPCPTCCTALGIRVTSRVGSGTAYGCVAAIDAELRSYQSAVETHTFSGGGSYTVTYSITGGPIVNGDGECGALSVVSTYDPEEDYIGTETVETIYTGEVTNAAVAAAATGGIVYADPALPAGSLHTLTPGPQWLTDDSDLVGPESSLTVGGAEATAIDTQVKYDLELMPWIGCVIVIQWAKGSDNSDLSRTTLTLTAVSPSSGWVSAPAPADNDSVYAKWIALRVGQYTTTAPALPA